MRRSPGAGIGMRGGILRSTMPQQHPDRPSDDTGCLIWPSRSVLDDASALVLDGGIRPTFTGSFEGCYRHGEVVGAGDVLDESTGPQSTMW
jgi:hypothetical protein